MSQCLVYVPWVTTRCPPSSRCPAHSCTTFPMILVCSLHQLSLITDHCTQPVSHYHCHFPVYKYPACFVFVTDSLFVSHHFQVLFLLLSCTCFCWIALLDIDLCLDWIRFWICPIKYTTAYWISLFPCVDRDRPKCEVASTNGPGPGDFSS